MEAPSVSQVTSTVGKALNWKTILVVFIITVIIMLLISRVMRQTVVLTDSNGNQIGTGEIKSSLKLKVTNN